MSAAAFSARAYDAFLRAERAAGAGVEGSWAVGRHVLRLRFAGPALADRLLPALAHVRAQSSGRPALTICVWDSASTDTPMPRSDLDSGRLGTRGMIRWSDGRRRILIDHETPATSILDDERKLAQFWVPDATGLTQHEASRPLRTVLYWWLGHQGYRLVHGAAVGQGGVGVLLVGRGGSGKSTTALACLQAGMDYAGDDYVALGDPAAPRVLSLYGCAKLVGDRLASFPDLQSSVRRAGPGEPKKVLLYPKLLYPSRMSRGFPLAAILLPRITGQTGTTLRRASPADSLKALAPSTVFQQRGETDPDDFLALGAYVRTLPSYWLELGTDLAQIPAAIGEILLGGPAGVPPLRATRHTAAGPPRVAVSGRA